MCERCAERARRARVAMLALINEGDDYEINLEALALAVVAMVSIASETGCFEMTARQGIAVLMEHALDAWSDEREFASVVNESKDNLS